MKKRQGREFRCVQKKTRIKKGDTGHTRTVIMGQVTAGPTPDHQENEHNTGNEAFSVLVLRKRHVLNNTKNQLQPLSSMQRPNRPTQNFAPAAVQPVPSNSQRLTSFARRVAVEVNLPHAVSAVRAFLRDNIWMHVPVAEVQVVAI